MANTVVGMLGCGEISSTWGHGKRGWRHLAPGTTRAYYGSAPPHGTVFTIEISPGSWCLPYKAKHTGQERSSLEGIFYVMGEMLFPWPPQWCGPDLNQELRQTFKDMQYHSIDLSPTFATWVLHFYHGKREMPVARPLMASECYNSLKQTQPVWKWQVLSTHSVHTPNPVCLICVHSAG